MKFFLITLFLFALIITPCFFLKNKPVHVSIDDCYLSLMDLYQNKSYTTIFNQPLLKELKELHEKTGAKFTLYTYASAPTDSFEIDSLSANFIEEFNENFDWLKIGFHAASPSQKRDDIKSFADGYKRFKKFSKQSKTIRLHYFYANQEQINLLKQNGLTTLLSADDNRISYSLPNELNESLLQKQAISLNGLEYKKTDFRIEKTFFPVFNIWSHMTDNEIIFFTHEWALSPLNKFKFKTTIFYLSLYGCKFISD
ncbi:MAG: hypothetical protein MJZ76_07295 [Bacteroidales bacterium]|nr:hypothetical protein [Bacteroidales bacterium]